MLLEGAMKAQLNIIISGGTGSGKTTLLNTLSSFISNDDRIVTIEDAAELQLQQDHVVRLETRPANIEGKGQIKATDLVRNCLRMRPDRIIIGECRGGETLDMLQAMNTGHEGSLTTCHANTPRDAIARLETMIMMAGFEMPIQAMRQQIANAVDLIVQANRLQGGPRKVTHITEIVGMEQDTIVMQDIFKYQQEGVDERGRAVGHFHGHRHPADVHDPPGIQRRAAAVQRVPRTNHAARLASSSCRESLANSRQRTTHATTDQRPRLRQHVTHHHLHRRVSRRRRLGRRARVHHARRPRSGSRRTAERSDRPARKAAARPKPPNTKNCSARCAAKARAPSKNSSPAI